MTNCAQLMTSACVLTRLHDGQCEDARVRALKAELDQARGSKESAMTLSEERLARALRAEDALVAAKNETLKTLLAERDNHGALLTKAFQFEDDAKLGRELLEVLGTVCDKDEGAVECAKRVIRERNHAQGDLAAVYDTIGLKGDDRCPTGVQGATYVDRNAIKLQRERADKAEAKLVGHWGTLAEQNMKLLQDERRDLVEELSKMNLLVNEYLTKAEKQFARAEKAEHDAKIMRENAAHAENMRARAEGEVAALKAQATSTRVGDAIDKVNAEDLAWTRRRCIELEGLNSKHLNERDAYFERSQKAETEVRKYLDRAESAEWKLSRAQETIIAQGKDSDAVPLYRRLQGELDELKQLLKEFRPPSLGAL